MKILRVLVLITLVCGFNLIIKAQADCRYGLKFSVRDEAGKIVENAKLELSGLENKLNLPSYVKLIWIDNAYLFTSHAGQTVNGNFQVKISVDSFETYQQKVNFPVCKIQSFDIQLRPLTNKRNISILTGTVYDQKGEVISQAKIIVQNKDGEKFETLTNADGKYKIDLPYTVYKTPEDVRTLLITRYTIQAIFAGFHITEIKDFIFTKPKVGSMELDITLEVGLLGDGNFNKNKKEK